MIFILSMFLFYVVGTGYYIHLLNERLHSYENNWKQIEKMPVEVHVWNDAIEAAAKLTNDCQP